VDYRIETFEDVTVVHLEGTFDRSVRGYVEMELLSLATYGIKLALEISGLDYISSAGLHLILDLYRRCEQVNGHMVVAAPSEPVREVLAMTGFTMSGLPVYDTLEEGLAALRTISQQAPAIPEPIGRFQSKKKGK
jgi:anti-anti-sigma factor